MDTVEIRLMGPIALVRDGVDLTPSQPKLRQLVSLLALSPGDVVTHETIASELWDCHPSPRRTRIVQTYVSQLRSLLGTGSHPQAITHVSQVGYRLAGDARSCDVDEVVRLLRLGAAEPPKALEAFREALALCRGPALSDVPHGPVLSQRRKRLDGMSRACLDRLVCLLAELGRPEAVLDHYGRIVGADVPSDVLHAKLITALAATGRADAAVRLFHEVRRDIAERTGLEPGDVLQQAYLEVLNHASTQATPELAVVAEPAGRAARRATTAAPAQLPIPPSTFIGFGAELAAARATLERPGGPDRGAVLAVVGGPGSGKTAFCTRLANQVARHYPGGQLHADLAVSTPTEALAGFIRAVGGERVELPANPAERIRLFRRLTSTRPVLVFVDNVTDVERVACLQPGSATGAMVLACRRRSWAEAVTGTLELRAADDRELMAMLAARVGAERLARDPEAARTLVAFSFGLPVAAAAMGALLRARPHWSPARLVERLTDGTGSTISLMLGGEELKATVERTMQMIPESCWKALLRLTHKDTGTGPWSVESLAEATGLRLAEAEETLEEAVAVRIAEPAVGADGSRVYVVHPLYRLAAAEWRRKWNASRVEAS